VATIDWVEAARGRCDPRALEDLWADMPEPMRLSCFAESSVPPEFAGAFCHDGTWRAGVDVSQLPEPMRREVAWCVFRIIELGGVEHAGAPARAEQGLHEIIRRNEPITFRGLAQTAGVSLDFLYRCTPIRQRVQQLRAQQQNTPPQPAATPTRDESASSLVRTLTAQLTELKRRHRDEIRALTQALEAAHGENLELRRRLGAQRNRDDTTTP
jgi:hypothetical protein